jgi:hypothetical protein
LYLPYDFLSFAAAGSFRRIKANSHRLGQFSFIARLAIRGVAKLLLSWVLRRFLSGG